MARFLAIFLLCLVLQAFVASATNAGHLARDVGAPAAAAVAATPAAAAASTGAANSTASNATTTAAAVVAPAPSGVGVAKALSAGADPFAYERADTCFKWARLRATAAQGAGAPRQHMHAWVPKAPAAAAAANATKARESVLVYGGCGLAHGAAHSLSHCSPALLRLDPLAQTWRDVPLLDAHREPSTLRVEGAAGVYHAATDAYFLFGGKRVEGGGAAGGAAFTNTLTALVRAQGYDDVVASPDQVPYSIKHIEMSPSTNTTTNTPPPPMQSGVLASAGAGALVLFGGFTDNGPSADVYWLDLVGTGAEGAGAFTWRKLAADAEDKPQPIKGKDGKEIPPPPAALPSGRVGHSLTPLPALPSDEADAADPAVRKHRFLLFGGSDGVRALGDAWQLTVVGGNTALWRRVAPTAAAGVTIPAPRAHHSVSTTRYGFRAVFFGGCDAGAAGGAGACYDDVHVLNTVQWQWEQLPASLAASAKANAPAGPAAGGVDAMLAALGSAPSATSVVDVRAPGPRRGATVVATAGGSKLFVLGGCGLHECAAAPVDTGAGVGAGASGVIFSLNLDAICPSSCVAGQGTYVEETRSGDDRPVPDDAYVGPHCACSPLAQGQFCQSPLPCPNACSGHGECAAAGKDGAARFCKCEPGFFGVDCATPACRRNCSGRGVCAVGPSPLYATLTPFSFASLLTGAEAAAANSNGTSTAHAQSALLALSDQAKARAKDIWFRSQSHCKCAPGFFGKDCSLARDADVAAGGAGLACPKGCSGHGLCDVGAGRCECQSGFAGADCAVECPSHCSGHGTCTHDGVCKCEPGFAGPDCSVRECLHDCSSNGVCDETTGECACTQGWGGAFCQVRTACSGKGKFIEEDGRCECEPGWGNAECSQPVTCAGGCSSRGVCVARAPLAEETRMLAKPVADAASLSLLEVDPTSVPVLGADGKVVPLAARVDPTVAIEGVCKCDRGFRGLHCEMRACAHRCRHGSCDAEGQCRCYPGHTGPDCSIAVPCPGNCTSAAHGQCTATGSCACANGWGGIDCAIPGCPNKCSGNGECREGRCYCAPGFSGLDCAQQCPNKCSGRGDCANGACRCHPGFEGVDCTIPSQCPRSLTSRQDCSGHGFCVRATKTCVCEPGFKGKDCSEAEGICEADTCGHHGTCRNGQCFCDLGFSGKRCEVANQCEDNCSGKGFCQHGRCHCYPGFEGAACATPVADPTCRNSCSGKGFCQHGRCYCQEGFAGEDCSKEVGFCAFNGTATAGVGAGPCSGNGVCKHGKCFCQPGASGDRCQIGGCRRCEAGKGVCVLGQCHCLPGFAGPDCSQELACPNNCLNKGVCVLGSCACLPGYSGQDCSTLTGAVPPGENTPSVAGAACPKDCSGKGVCRDGKCYCVSGYEGLDCGIEREAGCPLSCSGTAPTYDQRGACRYGKCFCKPGFAGAACEQELFCSPKCEQNGVCRYGVCHCLPGFTGTDCDVIDIVDAINKVWSDAEAEHAGATKTTTASPVSTFLDTSTTFRAPVTAASVLALVEVTVGNETHVAAASAPAGAGTNVTAAATALLFNNSEAASIVARADASTYVDEASAARHAATLPAGAVHALPEALSALAKPCGATSHGCGQHGLCVSSQCVCEPGYTGPDCSVVMGGQLWHRCPQACNKRGLCLLGKCYCDLGFAGASCDETVELPCPKNCSGFGQCSYGKCFCQPGFAGAACDKVIPCTKLCGAHGVCFKNQCVCAKGYAGEFCHLPAGRIHAHNVPAPSAGDLFNETALFHFIEASASLEAEQRAETEDGVVSERGAEEAHAAAEEAAAAAFVETDASASLARLPVSIALAPDEAAAAACPHACGAHGRCIAGACFCEAGFAGETCAIPLSETSALFRGTAGAGASATAAAAAGAARWHQRLMTVLTLTPLGADWNASPLLVLALSFAAGVLASLMLKRGGAGAAKKVSGTQMEPLLRA